MGALVNLATTGRIADNLGNRNILVQQEIIFAVAGLVRTSACSQCHNSEQRQHYFFHLVSPFSSKSRIIIIGNMSCFKFFIWRHESNGCAGRI